MSQKTKGIYNTLSNPLFYSFFQMIMSGTSFRSELVKKNITKKNSNVLDIGCGPAEILDSLHDVKYFSYDISSSLVGDFNKENILASVSVLHAIGLDNKEIHDGINSCSIIYNFIYFTNLN